MSNTKWLIPLILALVGLGMVLASEHHLQSHVWVPVDLPVDTPGTSAEGRFVADQSAPYRVEITVPDQNHDRYWLCVLGVGFEESCPEPGAVGVEWQLKEEGNEIARGIADGPGRFSTRSETEWGGMVTTFDAVKGREYLVRTRLRGAPKGLETLQLRLRVAVDPGRRGDAYVVRDLARFFGGALFVLALIITLAVGWLRKEVGNG